MANKYFNHQVGNIKASGGSGAKTSVGSGSGGGGMTEKTANWPGLPGKSGPNRSGGTPKAKTYPKSAGL